MCKEVGQDRVLNTLHIMFQMIKIQLDLKAHTLINKIALPKIREILHREGNLLQEVEEKIVFQE